VQPAGARVADQSRRTVREFFADLFSNPAYQPLDLTAEQVFLADELRFNRDPFDALICAAAQDTGLPLVTRDADIRGSGAVKVNLVITRTIAAATHGRYLIDAPAASASGPRRCLSAFTATPKRPKRSWSACARCPDRATGSSVSVQALHPFYRGRSQRSSPGG